jgi:hypothetical protein
MSALVKIDEHNCKVDRRTVLQSATAILTGAVLATSPLAAFAKGPAWSLDLFTLDKTQVTSLMAITRTICRHDKLEDLAYAVVVKAIDAEAAKDHNTQSLLTKGLTQLGENFATSTEEIRVADLKTIETTPFFQYVRLKTVQTLYTSPLAYAHFGYEGEAFSKGGYLFRGFDDLHWLPEVPTEDSGSVPGRSGSPGKSESPKKSEWPQDPQRPKNKNARNHSEYA